MVFRNTTNIRLVLLFLFATVLPDMVSSNKDKLNELIIDQIAHSEKNNHFLLSIRPETTMSCKKIQDHVPKEKDLFDLATIRKNENRRNYPLENFTLYNALWNSSLISLSKLDKVEDAILDLAERLSVDSSMITVKSAQSVTWGNGALGCKYQSGIYTQAFEQGYRIILIYKNKRYYYHGKNFKSPFLCTTPGSSVPNRSYPYKPGCKIRLSKKGLNHEINSNQHSIKLFVPDIKILSQNTTGVFHPEYTNRVKTNPGKLTYQYQLKSNKLSQNIQVEIPSNIRMQQSYILYSNSQEKYLAASNKQEYEIIHEIEYLKKKHSNMTDRLFELSRNKSCIQDVDCSAQLISDDCERSKYVIYSKINTEKNKIKKLLDEVKQINLRIEENKEILFDINKPSGIIRISNTCLIDDLPKAVCIETQCRMDLAIQTDGEIYFAK